MCNIFLHQSDIKETLQISTVHCIVEEQEDGQVLRNEEKLEDSNFNLVIMVGDASTKVSPDFQRWLCTVRCFISGYKHDPLHGFTGFIHTWIYPHTFIHSLTYPKTFIDTWIYPYTFIHSDIYLHTFIDTWKFPIHLGYT